MKVLEKKRKMFVEDYGSIQELYAELDEMHEEYLSWKWKSYFTMEVLSMIKNRKNTFLTSL